MPHSGSIVGSELCWPQFYIAEARESIAILPCLWRDSNTLTHETKLPPRTGGCTTHFRGGPRPCPYNSNFGSQMNYKLGVR
jgi:hypothetical protein